MRRIVLFIFAISILVAVTRPVVLAHAQEEVVETDTPVGIDTIASESATTQSARVDYELPYPGMLPDHPLYILKVIRDGIVKLLINDPMKRARFSLLSAEKRMYAGKMLVEKKKDALAIETIGKGNNYLNEALEAIEVVKKQTPKHTDIRPFLLQFKSATEKHLEIANDIAPFIDSNVAGQFEVESKRIEEFHAKAVGMLKQK